MSEIYKCNECDSVFSVPDKIRHRHNELDGGYWYETFEVCPICRGDDFEEVHQCLVCGEVIDSKDHLCNKCETELTDEETIIEFGADEPCEIKLNSLITYHYTTEEINNILLDHLKSEHDYQDKLEDFVLDTHDEFVEFVMVKNKII